MHDSPVERRRVTRALSTALAVTLTTSVCAFGAMSPASAVADPDHPFGLTVVADQAGPDYDLVATWEDADPKSTGTALEYDIEVTAYDPDTGDSEDLLVDTVEDVVGTQRYVIEDADPTYSYSVYVSLDGDDYQFDSVSADPLPGAPDEVTTVANRSTIQVEWDGNYDLAFPDSFDLVLKDDDGDEVDSMQVPADEDETADFTDVSQGTYTVHVSQRNATGHSEDDTTSTVVVDGKGSPSIPRNVVVTDVADQAVNVTWDAPADDGGLPATWYEIGLRQWDTTADDFADEADDDAYGRFRNAEAADGRSWTFYGYEGDRIPAGLTYKVTVFETNDRGSSPVWTSGVLTKESSAVSSAPRNVTATSGSANQVSVAWDAPETDGGKAVTDYYAVVDDGSNEGYGAWASFSGDARGGTIAGVKAGTWPVMVWAYNANGESPVGTAQVTVSDPAPPAPPAPPASPVVPVTAPTAPAKPKTTPVKPGGATTVTWKAPITVAGAPAIRYLVTVDGREFTTKRTTLKVDGLRAGPAKVVVRAVNKGGTSKAATLTIKVKKSVAQAPKPTLRPGQSGAAVKRLQKALGVKASGSFTKKTKSALVRWQKANDVAATGVANDRTRYLLDI